MVNTQFGKRCLGVPKTDGSDQQDEKWFVRLAGEVYGPYAIGKIKNLADQHLLEPDSSVCSTTSGTWEYAGKHEKLRHVFAVNRNRAKTTDRAAAADGVHNFILIVHLHAASQTEFEYLLFELGHWTLVTPGCWALKSSMPLPYIRNALTPLLSPYDSLVVTDTDTGQIATFNIGIEREVKLKTLWNRKS